MSEWGQVKFEDIYLQPSKNGLSRPKAVRGEGYKMVNMGELFKYSRIGNIDMERVQMSSKELENYSLEEGDLLFARQSLVAAGAGKCAIVLDSKETRTFESHLIRVRLDQTKSCPLYYFYYFQSDIGISKTQSLVNQVAAAGIRASELSQLGVHCPPVTIQKKVAALLESYDILIENNNRRIAILEEMAQKLYREWFVHFRFPGHENVKMVESDMGLIPEGWKWENLFDIADVQYGFAFKSKLFCDDSSLNPVVRIRDILGNRTQTYSPEVPDKRFLINNGDVLIGMDGIFHMNQWSGGCAYLNQRVVKLVSETISTFQLFYSLKPIISHLEATISGTTVAHLSDVDLKKIRVLVADRMIQKQANEIFQPLIREKITLQQKNTNLRKTRDLLLPRLISGDIDVSELDIPIKEGQP